MHLTQHYQVFPDARPDVRSRHTFRVTEEKGMGALQGCAALSAPAPKGFETLDLRGPAFVSH